MNSNDCVRPLKEEGIPGASLGGRSAVALTVVALRRWLLCRGAPTKRMQEGRISRQVMLLYVL